MRALKTTGIFIGICAGAGLLMLIPFKVFIVVASSAAAFCLWMSIYMLFE